MQLSGLAMDKANHIQRTASTVTVVDYRIFKKQTHKHTKQDPSYLKYGAFCSFNEFWTAANSTCSEDDFIMCEFLDAGIMQKPFVVSHLLACHFEVFRIFATFVKIPFKRCYLFCIGLVRLTDNVMQTHILCKKVKVYNKCLLQCT